MIKPLKIVFMGTPEFAVCSLNTIHNSNHQVMAVITAVDKPAGRGKKLSQSAVKKYAIENDIKVLQPRNLKAEEFNDELKTLKADLFVVVAFRMLPEMVWSLPKYGTINLHGSLLPDYRGAAPINWAVINGDSKTGVTTFFINEKIDTGEILLQEEIDISMSDTAGDVHDTMMSVGATCLLKTIDDISRDDIESKKQQWHQQLRKAPKIYKDDCRINWNSSSKEIYNLIRGLSPYPTAFTILESDKEQKKLKIFFAEIALKTSLEPGQIEIVDNKQLLIGTANGSINVTELQLEGKKRMKISSFLQGFRSEMTWKAL